MRLAGIFALAALLLVAAVGLVVRVTCWRAG